MKSILLLMFLLFSLCCYSQNNPDAIIGRWLKTPKEDLIIEVFKKGTEYNGRIAWTKNNDKKKPIGFVILAGLKYDSKKKMWDDGKIHDPNSHKSYDAEAKINSDGTLEVLGYVGLKFFGSTKYFKKIK